MEINRCLDQTLIVWQRRTTRELNLEDARQISENMAGFFALLAQWHTSWADPDGRGSPEGDEPR